MATDSSSFSRRMFLATTAAASAFGAAASAAWSAGPDPGPSAPLRTLLAAQRWLNTPPLRAEDLRGKVVLVNFCTYSCVNWMRVLPYARAWSRKYKDRGLVVIGVHSPEFTFEKDFANVRKAAASLGLDYPLAIDNDFAIWRAFDNRAWPAFYFVDANGRIRDHVFGEGGYDQSERLIQQLLTEAGGPPVPGDLVTVSPKGPEVAADNKNMLSDETYVGYAHGDNFASSDGINEDVPTPYRLPVVLPLNGWGLAGVWTVASEFATLDDASGRIAFRFHARDLNLVLTAPDHPVGFRVRIDGTHPAADHGDDVDADGSGRVEEPRLYQLVRQTRPIHDRAFEIEFSDAGVRAYVFTFG